jgi:hypothetical protein
MKVNIAQLQQGILSALHEPRFETFDLELRRRKWHVSPGVAAFAWAMAEGQEYDAFILAKMFDQLYQAWEKLSIGYAALAPRGSDPTIDGSFMSEFAENILRPEFFLLQISWTNYNAEMMLAVARMFDREFLAGRR